MAGLPQAPAGAPRPSARRAVFVDRDGVINEERRHVHRPQDFVLLPGAAAGLRRLAAAGWRLVVVTNQAGIGRGLYTEADYAHLTAHMRALLRAEGVTLDGVYHCPHHPIHGLGAWRVACACRKPAPGMLQRAAAELGLDLSRSAIVGDKRSDLDAGRAAGLACCVLVASGHPTDAEDRAAADLCCADLRDAARHLAAMARAPRAQASGRFATSVRMS
jgi:D-glycero-D-manno-heptose 1,7-bisphosphate phosphatase